MGLIDTHIHLLPGIDDGSPNLESTLEFARALYASGVRTAVCTPHLNTLDDPSLEAADLLVQVQEALLESGVPLRLLLGYEVGFALVAELPAAELFSYTLAGSRYLLLEVPHSAWPVFGEDAVHRLRLAGLIPVLAHPERNRRLRRDPDLVERLARQGAVFQGTTSSLLGLFGGESRRFLLDLLRNGYLGVLGTDAHYDRPETWDFGRAVARLDGEAPGFDGEMLTVTNPRLITENGQLDRAAPLSKANQPGALRSLGRYLKRVRG